MSARAMIERLLLGESDAMRHLRAAIERVAPTRLTVLIQGPTGAGKELVARALHQASGRTGRLVAFNVCAIPDSMFEDTVFGHVRGAFTGATHDAAGYLAEANGGTVFFDEIGGLAVQAQAKLLRAIETREFRPVGARADRWSDFRVVAATNDDLGHLAAAGRFRTDLVHRLAGFVMHVPPLAARMEDVPLLARHFAREAGGDDATLTNGALRRLGEHEWLGNVRELRQVVERAVVLSTAPVIDGAAVTEALSASRMGGARPSAVHGARRHLLEVLQQVRWDTARAAARLGVHRATVYRRMNRLGIIPPADLRPAIDGPCGDYGDVVIGGGGATPVARR